MKRVIASFGSVAVIVLGLGVAGAGPASAAACTVSPIQTWQAYNVNCSYAQHYDRLADGSYKYAPKVSPQTWSAQGVCWANVVSYGANRGVLVDYV